MHSWIGAMLCPVWEIWVWNPGSSMVQKVSTGDVLPSNDTHLTGANKGCFIRYFVGYATTRGGLPVSWECRDVFYGRFEWLRPQTGRTIQTSHMHTMSKREGLLGPVFSPKLLHWDIRKTCWSGWVRTMRYLTMPGRMVQAGWTMCRSWATECGSEWEEMG